MCLECCLYLKKPNRNIWVFLELLDFDKIGFFFALLGKVTLYQLSYFRLFLTAFALGTANVKIFKNPAKLFTLFQLFQCSSKNPVI